MIDLSFVICLPAEDIDYGCDRPCPRNAEKAYTLVVSELVPGSNRRISGSKMTEIIVAEDSPTQAVQLKSFLESAGHTIRLVSNGLEAINEVRQKKPDILVTDLEMPEMNGLEVVEVLRTEFPKLPIVLITSRGSELIAAEALQKGATSYVPKRVLDKQLLPTLEQALSLIAASSNHARIDGFVSERSTRYLVESDLSIVSALLARFQDELQQMGLCDESEAMQIAMALDEALTNAIVHGNLEISSELREIDFGEAYTNEIEKRRQLKPYSDRHVLVTVHISRHEVRYTIRDEGAGFDVGSIPDPTDEENIGNLCGRGLYLINAFMDEVRHNEMGNEIIMLKRKSSLNGGSDTEASD